MDRLPAVVYMRGQVRSSALRRAGGQVAHNTDSLGGPSALSVSGKETLCQQPLPAGLSPPARIPSDSVLPLSLHHQLAELKSRHKSLPSGECHGAAKEAKEVRARLPATRLTEEEQEQDSEEEAPPAEPEEDDGGEAFFKYSPGKLRGSQYKRMMTKEELEEEQRVQKEQLAAIFKLMEDNKETFGEMSHGDVQEQLRLYDM
ncbi:PREDICTED: matrix-remodeling-associated protein 7 [Myotis brandtii]|uniref:matrix-remodeling-associated protein 7 n=1 Tax=Myotis brandtii TaxID=109478 RepID=UPI0003BB74B8|nr:PREDICTED: matrix-remodeling-associated protein 7 [Myotis brandtii]